MEQEDAPADSASSCCTNCEAVRQQLADVEALRCDNTGLKPIDKKETNTNGN